MQDHIYAKYILSKFHKTTGIMGQVSQWTCSFYVAQPRLLWS